VAQNAPYEVIAKFVYDEIALNFGCPTEIIPDRGNNFTTNMLSSYSKLIGIINKYVDHALLACRIRQYSATSKTPFYMIYGVEVKLPGDEQVPIINHLVQQCDIVHQHRTKSDSALKHHQTSPILPRPKRSHERKRHTGSLTASITQVSIPKPYSPKKKGDEAKIAIVLDNTSWHNVLTLESKVLKRPWQKGQVQEWLNDHHIPFDSRSVKAELLELALANASPNQYITDQAAEQFNIQIARLPHRHCCLNPIELSWNNLKQYVRDNNVTFKANDVYNLILDFMGTLDTELATGYFKHVENIEQTFKDADSFLEEHIEPNLVEEETMTEEDDDDDE
ncbi:unnamed protein product, partial [Rotaria sordida]